LRAEFLESISGDLKIKVFTTRPDTLFGATYMVLAPEHEMVQKLKSQIKNWQEVEKYIDGAKRKSDLERTELQKEKTGVELKGIKAVNPANNEEIPIWVADYVLTGYGTGAIMAVPAHDERDFEFAKKFGLEIKTVVAIPPDKKIDGAERRDGAAALILNSENKILVMYDKMLDKYNFPRGGTEKGETPREAALREAIEETGYINLELMDDLGCKESYFYAADKKVNRHRLLCGFSFRLKDEKKQAVHKDDVGRYDLLWMSLEEAQKKLHFGEDKIFIAAILDPKKICFSGEGTAINSDFLDGLPTAEAIKKIVAWLEEKHIGKKTVNYKLRDWVFSRQRYWGEPIPLVHCEKCGWQPVPEKDLPVELPKVKKYEPTDTGESPLAAIEKWVVTKCPKCGGGARRETDTMPNWAGSSWYFMRYADPKNKKEFASGKNLKYWMPVDWYNGGMEHTTLHLLYSRFWYKFLYDIGAIPKECGDEPYKKRTSHGLILGEGGEKMSKSRGNVVNPDDIVARFGADTLRVYEMFMGPFEQAIPWDEKGVVGVFRFLERVWKLQEKVGVKNENKKIEKVLHQTIKKVGEDIEVMKFNTAVSQLMILTNGLADEKIIGRAAWQAFLETLAPFAPHLAEELWEKLGNKKSVHLAEWPKYNPALIIEEEIDLIIQINGKVRDSIKVKAAISEEEAKKVAVESEKVKKWIDGQKIKKIIFVKGRLVNIVV
jgi:leucyl-tRNA synthetase